MTGTGENMKRFEALSRLFWGYLGDMCYRPAVITDPVDDPYDGRAVAFLREMLQEKSGRWVRDAEMRARAAHDTPAFAADLALHVAQLKAYQGSAQTIWRLARQWVDESPFSAMSAINSSPAEVAYLALVVTRYLQRPDRKGRGRGQLAPSQFGQRVRALGGHWHLATMVLATLLSMRARILMDLVLARHDDDAALRGELPMLAYPGIRAQLARCEELWIPALVPRLRILCMLPDTLLEAYALELRTQLRHVEALHTEARMAAQATTRDLREARAESGSLRARLDQLGRRLELLVRRVDTRRTPPSTPPPAAGGRDLAAEQQARDLRRELDTVLARQLEQESEVLMLREFCTLLLNPPTAQTAGADRDTMVDLRQARVIVVGGRERFHHQLRRLLPNGVFLHPDLAVCPADVFRHADCVVYCFRYCSHKLAGAAIELARRHGIPSGYANHNNPAMVLETVRDVLSKG